MQPPGILLGTGDMLGAKSDSEIAFLHVAGGVIVVVVGLTRAGRAEQYASCPGGVRWG